MKRLYLYTAASVLRPEIGEYARKVHSELSKAFIERGVKDRGLLLGPDDVVEGENFSILLVATGGTEVTTLRLYEVGDKPLVLVATGLANSLAAALESVAALKSKGAAVELLYFDDWTLVDVDEVVFKALEVRRFYEVRGSRIGVLGEPSPWLVASSVDRMKARKMLGVNFIHIPLEEVVRKFEKKTLTKEDWKSIEKLIEESERVEISKKSLSDAYRLYLAIKEIVEQYNLNGVTVRCFDLIKELGTTACLALSLLNAELVVAGCEGDEQTILSMLVLSKLSGKPAWMGNPVRVDISANEIMLAHCTAPVNAGVGYRLKTHFESGVGVGVDVVYEEKSKVTIARISGDLEKVLLATGRVVKSGMEDAMHCRTQIRIRLDGNAKDLLSRSFGNHLALVSGDISDLIERYAELAGLKVVKV